VPVPVQSPPRVRFRNFELDLTSGELHKDGQKVSLSPKAFEVLRSLVERPGEVVTREDLRARLRALSMKRSSAVGTMGRSKTHKKPPGVRAAEEATHSDATSLP